MDLDENEQRVVGEFIDTRNVDLLLNIINHPWHYSGKLVKWAIDILCIERTQNENP